MNIPKRLALLSLMILAAVHAGTVAPTTITDITGDAASHQLAASGQARWVQFVALAANGAAVRIGDSNVGTSRGTAVAAGGGFLLPPIPNDDRLATADHYYNLASIYYYAGSGDKISVTWSN